MLSLYAVCDLSCKGPILGKSEAFNLQSAVGMERHAHLELS